MKLSSCYRSVHFFAERGSPEPQSFLRGYMVNIEEFARLFGVDPVAPIRETFGVPEPGLKPKTVQWQGQSLIVYDYDHFVALIKDWMKRYKQTKQEALDEFFGMFNT